MLLSKTGTPTYLSLCLLVISMIGCNNDQEINNDIEVGLLKNQRIEISELERMFHLYVPKTFADAPIVILLHGNKSSHDELIGLTNVTAPYKIWLDLAEQENILLIIPNGSEGMTGNNGWNDCRIDSEGNPNTDDVLFISALIDFAISKYEGNASRVYVAGTSNGGHMAIRLAQEIPDKLKAFASIVAANSVNTQCSNSSVPISAIFINGTEDPILPYLGGQMKSNRGEVFSTQESIRYWVTRNQTQSIPLLTHLENIDDTDNCSVTKHLYSNGVNNTEVALYNIIGGGHTEPSIEERYSNIFKLIVKEQNGDIEMAKEVWSFFKTK